MVQVLPLHRFIYIAQFHLYFLPSEITHNNMLLLLREMHDTSFACVLFLLLLVFLPVLFKIWSKKYFIDQQIANSIQLFIPIKRKFFGSLLFKTRRSEEEFPKGYLQKLLWTSFCILQFNQNRVGMVSTNNV